MKIKNSLNYSWYRFIPVLSLSFFVGYFSAVLFVPDIKFEHNLAAFTNPAKQISLAFNIANRENDSSVYDVNSLSGKYFIEVPKYNGMPFTINKEKNEIIVKVNSLSCSTINNSKNVNYGCKEVKTNIGNEKFNEFVAYYSLNQL